MKGLTGFCFDCGLPIYDAPGKALRSRGDDTGFHVHETCDDDLEAILDLRSRGNVTFPAVRTLIEKMNATTNEAEHGFSA